MGDFEDRLRDQDRRIAALAREGQEFRAKNADQAAEIERLESLVCDECTVDGEPSRWIENRVEGRVPCICITESEPYQALAAEIESKGRIIANLEKLYGGAIAERDEQAAEIKWLKIQQEGASKCCVQCEEHTREIAQLKAIIANDGGSILDTLRETQAQRDELLEAAEKVTRLADPLTGNPDQRVVGIDAIRNLCTAIDRARGGAK